MEWSGEQQIRFLLLSVMLGGVQGFALDAAVGLVPIKPKQRWIWMDVLFGPVSAVITLFGAIIIMDGHLHPLLIVGVVFGMVFEHLTVGLWVARCVRFCRRVCQKVNKRITAKSAVTLRKVHDLMKKSVKTKKKAQKAEK